MSFTSFEEQFKTVILEYLSPAAYSKRLKKSTDIASRQAPKRAGAVSKKFGKDTGAGYYLGGGGGLDHTSYDEHLPDRISKLSSKRKERVARVEKGRGGGARPLGKPTKLSKRGFDDQDMPNRPAKTRKPSYDGGHRVRTGRSTTGKYGTAGNLEKILKGKLHIDKDGDGSKREQTEQFKNAILNYLNEISAEGAGKVAGRFQRAVITGQKKTDKSGKDIESQVGRIRKKFDKRKPAVNRNDGGIKYRVPGDADTFDAARTTVGKDANEPLVRASTRKTI